MTVLKQIPVRFDQEAHTYQNTETGAMLKGITGTLIHRLFPDKYKDIPKYILDRAAERGTQAHEELELINSLGITPTSEEGRNYKALAEANNLCYLASEYTVSDLTHYATNIDVIYEAGSNVVDIADYKTTSRFDKESVSWQLSICAYMLELNNPDVRVRRLYGIWLRGETAKLIEVERHPDDEVRALMEADIEDRDFEYSPAFPDYITQNEQRLIWLMGKIREYSEECEQIKEQVREQMEANGDKSFDTGNILITMVAPSVRETFDSKKFKAEHEDMYGQYVKKSATKPTLKLTLR